MSLQAHYQFNLNGGKLIRDTAAHSIDGYGFLVIEDAVISAITLGAGEQQTTNAYTSATFSAGTFVPVKFTSITLTSGSIKAMSQ